MKVKTALIKEDTKVLNSHKLKLEDILTIGSQAFKFRWYDVAIDFFKVALNYNEKIKPNINKMIQNLVILNNQNLFKYQKTVDKEFKIKPYIVTEKLKRKKLQPDFVIEELDLKSRQGKEDHFRKVCGGKVSSRNENVNKCNYLHHMDPFLKLGPFKLEIVSKGKRGIKVK